MKNNKIVTLGIETSCDDTSVAVVLNGREILSNIVSSQIKIHEQYGGVVPEIASRHHLENINIVLDEALKKADTTLDEVDHIGVTHGPGLVGALLVGIATAKAISFAKDIPLNGVHHIQSHVCANYISHPTLEPPFIALVVSGGHTEIVEVSDYSTYKLIGKTRDDAIGEAYDKVARVLGFAYPGGPKIDEIAKQGNPDSIHFKRVYLEKGTYDFSFSGTKTGVLNYINTKKQAGEEVNIPDLAASFQQAVLEVIVSKTLSATKASNINKLALAGGVAANSRLRELLREECKKEKIEFFCPSLDLCTDNAAMIASRAYYNYIDGQRDDWLLDAYHSPSIQ